MTNGWNVGRNDQRKEGMIKEEGRIKGRKEEIEERWRYMYGD